MPLCKRRPCGRGFSAPSPALRPRICSDSGFTGKKISLKTPQTVAARKTERKAQGGARTLRHPPPPLGGAEGPRPRRSAPRAGRWAGGERSPPAPRCAPASGPADLPGDPAGLPCSPGPGWPPPVLPPVPAPLEGKAGAGGDGGGGELGDGKAAGAAALELGPGLYLSCSAGHRAAAHPPPALRLSSPKRPEAKPPRCPCRADLQPRHQGRSKASAATPRSVPRPPPPPPVPQAGSSGSPGLLRSQRKPLRQSGRAGAASLRPPVGSGAGGGLRLQPGGLRRAGGLRTPPPALPAGPGRRRARALRPEGGLGF